VSEETLFNWLPESACRHLAQHKELLWRDELSSECCTTQEALIVFPYFLLTYGAVDSSRTFFLKSLLSLLKLGKWGLKKYYILSLCWSTLSSYAIPACVGLNPGPTGLLTMFHASFYHFVSVYIRKKLKCLLYLFKIRNKQTYFFLNQKVNKHLNYSLHLQFLLLAPLSLKETSAKESDQGSGFDSH
jgi:hypothetical protein